MSILIDKISNALKQWHKEHQEPYALDIFLEPEDYILILKEPKVILNTETHYSLFGLNLIRITDEELGWIAMEYTGWNKNNPELLKFVAKINFRNLIYKDNT